MADMHPGAQEFLEERTRLGMVTTLRRDGSPCTVPLWYDWDGTTVRFFSGATTAKLKRVRNDSRITLTVSSEMDEDLYRWVSFEGRATVSRAGARNLAVALARRYSDQAPDNPGGRELIATFEGMPEEYIRLVEFVPERGFTMLGDDRVVPLFQD